eukprot:GFKZ01012458.1.p1 GENE.GFKZ01012458.1~~GFKZ01012458.1.p1  ORF type:complete len:445 (-),score=38.61 GFKZ01012458.1:102-1436(-)
MAVEPSAQEFPPLKFELHSTTDHPTPTSPQKVQQQPHVSAPPDYPPVTPIKMEPLATTPPPTDHPAAPDHLPHLQAPHTDSAHPLHVTSPILHDIPASQSLQHLHPAPDQPLEPEPEPELDPEPEAEPEPEPQAEPEPEPAPQPEGYTEPDAGQNTHQQDSEYPMEHRPLEFLAPAPYLTKSGTPPHLPEHNPSLRNSSRRRVQPERLSPTSHEPRSEKVCKRVECGAAGVRHLYTGPDGPGTLCYNCYMKYRALRLAVYMDEISGYISIAPQADMTPMRVYGFEPRAKDGTNDLSRPRLIRLQDTGRDAKLLAYSQGRGGVRKRRRSVGQKASEGRKQQRLSQPRPSQPRPLSEGLKEGEGVYVKAEWRSDMRRFRVPVSVTLHAFREELRRVFQWKREQLFCITFRDESGDFVRLGEESKMARMFQTVKDQAASPVRVRIVS